MADNDDQKGSVPPANPSEIAPISSSMEMGEISDGLEGGTPPFLSSLSATKNLAKNPGENRPDRGSENDDSAVFPI